MQHASLIAFLDGDMSPVRFSEEITPDVDACRASIKATRHGRIIITDGPETVLTRDRIRRLLQAVVDKTLSFEAANYTADCIIMSHTFDWEDELVGEAVHFMADDYPPPTEDEVRSALSRLGEPHRMDSFALVNQLARDVPRLAPLLAEHKATYDAVLPHVFFGELTPFLIDLNDGSDADRLVLRDTLSSLERAWKEGDESTTNVISVSFIENLQGRGKLRAMQSLFGPALSSWADCFEDSRPHTARIGWFEKLLGRLRT